MGTFILPARLKAEFSKIEELYLGKVALKNILSDYPEIKKHEDFIKKLYVANVSKEDYQAFSRAYMSDVCKEVLKNTACFKDDEVGRNAFIEFFKILILLKLLLIEHILKRYY